MKIQTRTSTGVCDTEARGLSQARPQKGSTTSVCDPKNTSQVGGGAKVSPVFNDFFFFPPPFTIKYRPGFDPIAGPRFLLNLLEENIDFLLPICSSYLV